MKLSGSRMPTGAGAAALAFLAGSAALAPSGAHAVPSLRSELYSVAGVNRFCANAQKIKSNTALTPTIIVHPDPVSFSGSSAAPYEGFNVSAYNAKSLPEPFDSDGNPLDPNWDVRGYGGTLPFTVQQLVSYNEIAATNLQIPTVISCKMKTSGALRFHLGATAAIGTGTTCVMVNQDTVTKVFASLTAYERRYLKYNESQIVLDPDPVVASGPDWLYPLLPVGAPANVPTPPTTAYIGASDGLLHIQSKSLQVERNNQSPLVGPDKRGTTYCHLIAPEYLRSVVTGTIPPFVSPYFPQ